MGGTITSRSWRVSDVHGEQHIVQLRHNNVSGRRVVLVDGREISNSLKIIDAEENIPFNIGTKRGMVMIRIDYFTFTYECRYEGRPMPEMTFDIRDQKDTNYSCSIPSVAVENIRGKRVAVFRVEMTCDGRTEVFRKRFRDFATFDTFIRGGYDGHHLLQNLPKLPPKQMSLFVDHFSKSFLEERRKQLEIYVNKLVKIPKVTSNPDFIAFLCKRKSPKQRDLKNDERGEEKYNVKTAEVETNEYREEEPVGEPEPEGEGMVDVNFNEAISVIARD